MIDINNFDAIEIGLASSKQIQGWSSGEVHEAGDHQLRTLKPEKDGLFCERIFSPTKDWECYCGKYKRVRYKGIVCERCGVEVASSSPRADGPHRPGRPVSHIWFFKGVPSRIGYLLDMAPKELEDPLLRRVDHHLGRPGGALARPRRARGPDAGGARPAAGRGARAGGVSCARSSRPPAVPGRRLAGRLQRRGPAMGRVAGRQRQEALRRGAQEARDGPAQVVHRRHRRHRGLLRGRAHASRRSGSSSPTRTSPPRTRPPRAR